MAPVVRGQASREAIFALFASEEISEEAYRNLAPRDPSRQLRKQEEEERQQRWRVTLMQTNFAEAALNVANKVAGDNIEIKASLLHHIVFSGGTAIAFFLLTRIPPNTPPPAHAVSKNRQFAH